MTRPHPTWGGRTDRNLATCSASYNSVTIPMTFEVVPMSVRRGGCRSLRSPPAEPFQHRLFRLIRHLTAPPPLQRRGLHDSLRPARQLRQNRSVGKGSGSRLHGLPPTLGIRRNLAHRNRSKQPSRNCLPASRRLLPVGVATLLRTQRGSVPESGLAENQTGHRPR